MNDLLVKYFDNIFNVGFTATMEEHLDSIANGKEEMVPVLRAFYGLLRAAIAHADATMEKVMLEPEKTGEAVPGMRRRTDHQERAVRQVRGVCELSDLPVHQAAAHQGGRGLPEGWRRPDRAADAQGAHLLRLRQLSGVRFRLVAATAPDALPALRRPACCGEQVVGGMRGLP